MNEGVKILLERMKTNPDEFTKGSKWAGVIHGYKSYLSVEDAKTLDDAYNALMQQEFTEKVMTELLAPEEDDSLGKPWYTKRQAGTQLGGATPVRSSVTLNNTNAINSTTVESQLHQILHMKAQMELERQKQQEKKHETLYGRLKNYLYNDEKDNEIVEDSMGRKFINGVLQR